ncbi:hypothetical protein NWF32_15865 [Pseudomonas qingdaonensis]|nr:hypothetical protein [Pseudomonas qingdaonensis]
MAKRLLLFCLLFAGACLAPSLCANEPGERSYELLSRSGLAAMAVTPHRPRPTGSTSMTCWYWALRHRTTRRSTSPPVAAITRA